MTKFTCALFASFKYQFSLFIVIFDVQFILQLSMNYLHEFTDLEVNGVHLCTFCPMDVITNRNVKKSTVCIEHEYFQAKIIVVVAKSTGESFVKWMWIGKIL